jgi:hypothetical protein
MKMMMIGLALAGALAGGCYTTRIVSGVPAKTVAPMAQDRWHHSVVAGIAEISPPVDLDAMCTDGDWAEIKEEMTFLNGVVNAGTGGIYTPRTYTLSCGPAPAPAGSNPAVSR